MTDGSSVLSGSPSVNLLDGPTIDKTTRSVPHIDPAILDEAVTWFATLASGQAASSQEAVFSRWRATHPDHDRAWQRLRGVQRALQHSGGATSKNLARQVVLTVGSQRAARRRALEILDGMAPLGGSGVVASYRPQWRGLLARHLAAR